jgi:hypothetical protein
LQERFIGERCPLHDFDGGRFAFTESVSALSWKRAAAREERKTDSKNGSATNCCSSNPTERKKDDRYNAKGGWGFIVTV